MWKGRVYQRDMVLIKGRKTFFICQKDFIFIELFYSFYVDFENIVVYTISEVISNEMFYSDK